MKNNRIVFLLTVANKRLQQWVQANGEGRAASRHGVLMSIRNDGAGTSFGEVGRALNLGTSSLSGLVDRMVASGLIERMADAGDGRASRLRLTGDGRIARKRAVDQARALDGRLREGFSDEELTIVSRWLAAVDERLSSESAPSESEVEHERKPEASNVNG